MTEKLIDLKNISKTYKNGQRKTKALVNINLTINKGEFVAIMGPSGSGKSSLLHIIGLIDKATSGKYTLLNHRVNQLTDNQQAKIRSKTIGFVFQQFNLLARTNVIDNVLLPTIYGKKQDYIPRATKLVEQVGLEKQAFKKSNQLSGGEIQRVAIARALIMDPEIILADEPTGNLDTKTAKEIMGILKKINRQGKTIILITHEDHIAKYAKRIIKIKDGEIISDHE